MRSTQTRTERAWNIPFQSSGASPQPLNTRLKYICFYLFIFFNWLSAAVMVPKSHDEGGVADRYQPLSVSLTTADPVLVDPSQHQQFLPFAEAELRTGSRVVAQRSYWPEDTQQRCPQPNIHRLQTITSSPSHNVAESCVSHNAGSPVSHQLLSVKDKKDNRSFSGASCTHC